MQQAAGCLSVRARGAAGQEAPGPERMHEAPGSGPASATGALAGTGPEKPVGEVAAAGARVHKRARGLEHQPARVPASRGRAHAGRVGGRGRG